MKFNSQINHINFGFSLIEILVSVCIVSVGLLSLAESQWAAIQGIQTAYWRSQAQQQLTALFEQLQAVKTPAMRLNEINIWKKNLPENLPSGSGAVDRHGDNYIVTVYWTGSFIVKQKKICPNAPKQNMDCVTATIFL